MGNAFVTQSETSSQQENITIDEQNTDSKQFNPKFGENQFALKMQGSLDAHNIKKQPLGHEAFVKIGDVIMLKGINEKNLKYFIQGDGILESNLYLGNFWDLQNKVDEFSEQQNSQKIQQCLFQIKVAKSYYSQDINQEQQQLEQKSQKQNREKLQLKQSKSQVKFGFGEKMNKVFPDTP